MRVGQITAVLIGGGALLEIELGADVDRHGRASSRGKVVLGDGACVEDGGD
jgi:hypothetical protein